MSHAIKSSAPRASIVISSYNYGRFLGQAIDSALGQSYPATEVIVVDDGSTDHSREVIAGYESRVTPVLKPNGGQASAFNAGFATSRGDVVLFLDSDDVLLPTAVAAVMPLFGEADVVKAHWPLWEVDGQGRMTGDVMPRAPLPEGDLRMAVLRGGPDGYNWPPTSGNAWSRRFLERVLPIPEPEYRTCPDFYLAALAPLFGHVGRVPEPQGCWRIHGGNHSWDEPIDRRLEVMRRRLEHCLAELGKHCRALGLEMDPEACRANSWWQWLRQSYLAVQEIEALVPPGEFFILANEDAWDTREIAFANRRPIPFLEKDGEYWGAPPDDRTAITELERLRRAGAAFLIIAWPAFWWLEHYRGFADHLRSRFRRVLENERLVVFDLRP